MRVVFVNWARLADGALVGGGANGYALALARGLAALGHEVMSISAGMAYTPARRPKDSETAVEIGPIMVRRMPDVPPGPGAVGSIRVLEILNSPVVAPGFFQFMDPMGEISHPELERVFTRVLHDLRPDVVHFHNIEGFTLGCIDAARVPAGDGHTPRVVFSLHNYHTVCPQVYLMQGGRTPCADYRFGEACVSCVAVPPPGHEIGARRRGYLTENRAEPRPVGLLGRLLGAKQEAEIPLPGRVYEAGALWREEFPPETRASGGGSSVGVGGEVDVASIGPATEDVVLTYERTPIVNGLPRQARLTHATNPYGVRRREMVAALSRCDRVLAVSHCVREIFVAMGVDDQKLEMLTIGSEMGDLAVRGPRSAKAPTAPVRLGFLGYNNFYKGLHVLVDALQGLDRETVGRLELVVRAKDVGPMVAGLKRLADPIRSAGCLAGLTIGGAYAYSELPEILAGVDVGIVPSVWWDNGPQTVMEFLSCGVPVLGAEVGGIPDFVRDGENGLLFRGNDARSLREALTRLVREEELVERLRAGVNTPKGMREHAKEMERVYERALGSLS